MYQSFLSFHNMHVYLEQEKKSTKYYTSNYGLYKHHKIIVTKFQNKQFVSKNNITNFTYLLVKLLIWNSEVKTSLNIMK